MNIILMLIGVVIVYNILRITYRDNWSRNLSVDVTFSSNTATKGDTIKMVETVTNAKRMPLPCVNIKFCIDKNLVSKLIIEAHHGNIRAGNSDKYGGAQFKIILPLYKFKGKL